MRSEGIQPQIAVEASDSGPCSSLNTIFVFRPRIECRGLPQALALVGDPRLLACVTPKLLAEV
jgi:hypothetical protein